MRHALPGFGLLLVLLLCIATFPAFGSADSATPTAVPDADSPRVESNASVATKIDLDIEIDPDFEVDYETFVKLIESPGEIRNAVTSGPVDVAPNWNRCCDEMYDMCTNSIFRCAGAACRGGVDPRECSEKCLGPCLGGG